MSLSYLLPSGTWGNTGTAGAVSSGTRSTDTIVAIFQDLAPYSGDLILQVSSSIEYTPFEVLFINGNNAQFIEVEEVYTPIPSVTINDIYYYSGIIGKCIVTPTNVSPGADYVSQSEFDTELIANLKRGSLVQIDSEVVMVQTVTQGPNGAISFETTTLSPHTSGSTLMGVNGIRITNPQGFIIAPGNTIVSKDWTWQVTAGIGLITETVSPNLFNVNGVAFQPEDYIHFSINVDDLTRLTEIKILFDVNGGTFINNFYYYTVRPSDITNSINNTLTQLGAAQIVTQKAIIDEENAAMARNQGRTASGAQTSPGSNQWSEIMIPISALTRVGSNQARTLNDNGAMQFLVNCSATINLKLSSVSVRGGNQPDVGYTGAPYKYITRPRSSLTGVKGNPSPPTRYGVSPRRRAVVVVPPDASYDSQIDTWDVFRYGGTVTSWRKIGQCGATFGVTFIDNYPDDAALAGEELEYDNLEPWPSIDMPFNLPVAPHGTSLTFNLPLAPFLPTLVSRYLPGNLIRLTNGNVYTLRNRPVNLGGSIWRMDLNESIGPQFVSVAGMIYEPLFANQAQPYLWGPDAAGTIFGCGDPMRPGILSFCKSNNPDSAPDTYNVEITSPSEPLLGGETIDGLSYVASPERWWALYPQFSNTAQRYSVVQQPFPRGLAAPFGSCTDGRNLYWWAKDGIYASYKGSLTDGDLYNLFPHDGVSGINRNYLGNTVFAPDYSRCAQFRLTHCNGYLYATYQDSNAIYRKLVCDLRTVSWYIDDHGPDSITVTHHPEQPEGTLLVGGVLTKSYPLLYMGTLNGNVATESPFTNDLGGPINCVVCTAEWTAGDIRALHQWGDFVVDCLPAAQGGGAAITVTAQSEGVVIATAPVTPLIPGQLMPKRTQFIEGVGGYLLAQFFGVGLSWADDFTKQSLGTTLYLWQPTYLDKPEQIVDRITDWHDNGTNQNKYWQGFLLRADTGGIAKTVNVRDSDTMALHSYLPNPVVQNGETVVAYSFSPPFYAHSVRLEPVSQVTDGVKWRLFAVDWVTQPTPENAETWQAQGTAFGLTGYNHVKMADMAYASTQPVTLTVVTYDGQSPVPITMPATGGGYQKRLFMFTPNKGLLYFFRAASSAPFQLYVDDCDVYVGNWGRSGNYTIFKSLGGIRGDQARI
jgi:hypothetical protein